MSCIQNANCAVLCIQSAIVHRAAPFCLISLSFHSTHQSSNQEPFCCSIEKFRPNYYPTTDRPSDQSNKKKSARVKPNRISKVLCSYYRQQTIIIPSNVRVSVVGLACFLACLLSAAATFSLPLSSVKCISI